MEYSINFWEEASPQFVEVIFNQIINLDTNLLRHDLKNQFIAVVKLVEQETVKNQLGSCL